MTVLALYATMGGTTRKVADRVVACLDKAALINVREFRLQDHPQRPDALLLFCPTYGDSEFEESFEDFLDAFDWSNFEGVGFAFCELGIYTGYEDFGHGLIAPLYERLEKHGLHPILPALSLDTVPVSDWGVVDDWGRAIAKLTTVQS